MWGRFFFLMLMCALISRIGYLCANSYMTHAQAHAQCAKAGTTKVLEIDDELFCLGADGRLILASKAEQ